MGEAIAIGVALGLGSGLSPGPLLSVLVLASLRGGLAAGARVAVVPLITDAPIVLLALTVVSGLPERAVTVLSVVGGLVVIVFGVQSLRGARRPAPEPPADVARRSMWQGILVNLVSPHPWLFWITVGAPLTVATWQESNAAAVAFVCFLYAVLVASKLVIAALVSAGRRRMSDRTGRALAVGAGVLMVASGMALVVTGVG